MSNFLQRVIGTVGSTAGSTVELGPGLARPRLQPMLGSVFAGDGALAAAYVPAPFSEFAISGEGTVHPSQPAVQAAAIPALLHSAAYPVPVAEETTTIFRQAGMPPLRGDAYSPLVPGTVTAHADAPIPRQRANFVGPEASLATSASYEASSASAASASAFPASTPAAGGAPRAPNLAPQRSQPLQLLQPLIAPRVSATSTGAVGLQRQTQREPDEIHIHIGRIEVAAAPPPSPRVVAAANRKSLSLDEYLKRGTGRHG